MEQQVYQWENSLFKLSNFEVFGLKIKVPDNANLYLKETYQSK